MLKGFLTVIQPEEINLRKQGDTMRTETGKKILKYNKFLSVFRLFSALAVGALALFFQRFRIDAAAVLFAYTLFAAALVFNKHFRKKITGNYKYFIIILDIFFVTAVIILTGGSASVYWPFYLVAIISFSVSRGGFSGVFVASSSILCYTAAIYCTGGSFKNIPADFLIGVFIVAFLTTLLVGKDRKATMKLVSTDALTGAYNFSCFQDRINSAVKYYETTGKPVSLLFIDVDDFKFINDTFGHQRGDDVLKAISKAIMSAVRSKDMVFRYGGDEFAVLLQNAAREQAFQVAERVRQNVRSSAETLTTFKRVTVSIGVAVLDDESTDGKEFMKAADRSLYEAKKQGKNRIRICTPG